MSADTTHTDIARAVELLHRARQRILELERGQREPIAIVGAACQLPGGIADPEALWTALRDGRELVSEVPGDRFDIDAFYDPDPLAAGRSYCRRGGFLDDIWAFDAEAFGISAAEAEAMDPQHRLVLEVAWDALERAGHTRARLFNSRTGVYVGICHVDYIERFTQPPTLEQLGVYAGSGSMLGAASGRLAYALGLRGPALTLDTACSSSLVTVHLACQALRSRDCDAAIACGVNAILSPLPTVVLSRMGLLSRAGRTRPFDGAADGFVQGEGCVAVVLKRLPDAEADGDPILAVIEGSAVAQNGQGNGLQAPRREAQEEVIRAALRRAGVAPAEVGFVQGAGTATPLGDAVEALALDAAFRDGRTTPLLVGAVKANLGHGEAAAGATSLLAAVLCLQHQEIIPTLSEAGPHVEIPWRSLCLELPRAPRAWPDGRRIAGVSAFGYSGTNAHLVIAEAPARTTGDRGEPVHVLPVSANTAALLRRWTDQLAAQLEVRRPALAAVAAALQHGRDPQAARAAICACNLDQAIAALRRIEPGQVHGDDPGPAAAWLRGEVVRWPLSPHAPRVELPARPRDRRQFRVEAAPLPARRPRAPADEIGEVDLEAWVVDELRRIAGGEPALDAAFDTLGIDSLRAVELIQRVQARWGVQLYPTEVFEHRTGRGLADHLRRLRGQTPPVAQPSADQRERVLQHLAFPAIEPGDGATVGAAAKLPRIAFILSSPRTGSTLLRTMLAGHPGLFAPPELHLLPFADLAAWHARFAGDLLTGGLTAAWLGLGARPEQVQRRLDADVARGRRVEDVYAELIAQASPRLVVDKSPSYGLAPWVLARSEQLFDAPLYIHLVRHPAPAIDSFVKRRIARLFDAESFDPQVVAEQAWLTAHRNIVGFLEQIPAARQHPVMYEELVDEPEAVMRSLCRFLGLAFDPAVLTPYEGERMVPRGGTSFVGDPGFGLRSAIERDLGSQVSLGHPLQPETQGLARWLGYPLDGTGVRHLRAAARLPEAIRPGSDADARGAAALGPGQRVLLTGATGHLGPWLLAALLEAGVASVYALVRAGTEAEAAARIQGALAAIGRAELWSQASGRIVALPGQLGAPALGLSAARWRLLSEAIDSIVHSAAQVSFATTWHQLYPANVEGTREVIRLACEGRRKAIHHISTKGVFAPAAYPGDAPILEDEPLRTPRGDVIGYQQTKWAAEWLLEQARARGVPVAIYRPGRIAGDAHGRHMPEGDLFVRFARTCIDLGCAPEVGFALELTPVDWVAHAIAHIAQRSESIGHAFHLVHPEPLPLAEVVAELQRQGRSLCLVPYAEWRARLHARGGRGPLAPVLAMFAEALPTQLDDRRLAQDNTRTQLRGSDLVLPAVAVQLAQLVAHSFAKEPS